jgi:hypothetical protein
MLIKRKEEKFGIRFSVTDSHFPSKLFNFVEDTGYLDIFKAGMKTQTCTGIIRSLQRLITILAGAWLILHTVSCKKDSTSPVPVKRTLQVWLHRVNTISKAQHFQNSYTGFELDVHYDTVVKTFIVKHDATDTSTLTFSAWLSAITDPGRLGYWLDFKNLDADNKDLALPELLRIRQNFGLDKKVIVVESSSPSSLIKFDTLNFCTSYYIPTFDPSGITQEEELSYMNFIDENTSPYRIGTISGYYNQHGFMQKWFPQMNKLLWYLDSTDPAIKDSIIRETRKDITVEVLLVAEDY